MDNADQSSLQQSTPGGGDVSGIEAAVSPAPVSIAPKKEQESSTVTGTVEHIRSSEPELNIHPEIAGMMEKISEHPILTQEDKEAGIKLSNPEPVITAEKSPQPAMESLPMTESQAIHTVKTGNPNSTKRWFAHLILKVIEKVKKQNKLSPRSV